MSDNPYGVQILKCNNFCRFVSFLRHFHHSWKFVTFVLAFFCLSLFFFETAFIVLWINWQSITDVPRWMTHDVLTRPIDLK